MNLELHLATLHQLVELGAAGPSINPFYRSEVWRREIRNPSLSSTPHLTLLLGNNTRTQVLISLGHPAVEPLISVLNGKHLHPSCASSRAKDLLSHPIPSHPHALIPTCLCLSQMCETAVSWTTLSTISPKSYDSHVLLKIFYISYDFFFSLLFLLRSVHRWDI